MGLVVVVVVVVLVAVGLQPGVEWNQGTCSADGHQIDTLFIPREIQDSHPGSGCSELAALSRLL